MTRVLGVHGIGNFDPHREPGDAAAALAATWWQDLVTGGAQLALADVDVAYWASHLDPRRRQGADTDPTALTPPERDVLAALVAEVDIAAVRQGRLTLPVRQAVALLASRSGMRESVMSAFVARFCREVHAYLAMPDAPGRIAAREEVAVAVASCSPRVVVAHSLGSVIAYEALWAKPELEVELLVTLGSPLGLPGVVFDRLRPAPRGGRGARPPGVRRWLNIADRGDVVAVPRWLSQQFTGVDDDIEVSVGHVDFHRVASYLQVPALVEAVNRLT